MYLKYFCVSKFKVSFKVLKENFKRKKNYCTPLLCAPVTDISLCLMVKLKKNENAQFFIMIILIL